MPGKDSLPDFNQETTPQSGSKAERAAYLKERFDNGEIMILPGYKFPLDLSPEFDDADGGEPGWCFNDTALNEIVPNEGRNRNNSG